MKWLIGKTTLRNGDSELAGLEPGQRVGVLNIGVRMSATVAADSFNVQEGDIALSRGSSGHVGLPRMLPESDYCELLNPTFSLSPLFVRAKLAIQQSCITTRLLENVATEFTSLLRLSALILEVFRHSLETLTEFYDLRVLNIVKGSSLHNLAIAQVQESALWHRSRVRPPV